MSDTKYPDFFQAQSNKQFLHGKTQKRDRVYYY